MTAANGDMRAWLESRGHDVNKRGRVRAELAEIYYAEHPDERPPGSVALLPSPDEWEEGGYDDLGFVDADPEQVPRGPYSEPQPPREPLRYEAVPDAPQAPTADSGPAHGRKEWRKTARDAPAKGGHSAPRKVTVSVRSDINAKISLVLEVPGRVWQARDPVCGSAFIEQRPAIADALTEIVCNSPDLVAWFAGQGGQFMLWFNLIMAVWPVAMTAAAHHVYHTIDEQADYQQPDYQDYAA